MLERTRDGEPVDWEPTADEWRLLHQHPDAVLTDAVWEATQRGRDGAISQGRHLAQRGLPHEAALAHIHRTAVRWAARHLEFSPLQQHFVALACECEAVRVWRSASASTHDLAKAT
jgi:hypothetical protein